MKAYERCKRIRHLTRGGALAGPPYEQIKNVRYYRKSMYDPIGYAFPDFLTIAFAEYATLRFLTSASVCFRLLPREKKS